MRRATGDTFVGAGEGARTLLNKIGLSGILPIEREQGTHSRPAGGDFRWIKQIVFRIGQLRGVGTFRYFDIGIVKALHVTVDIRRNAWAGLENNDADALLAQFISDQRSSKSGSDDRDIALHAIVRHGWLP